jgi:hypothetical protein
MRHAIRAFTRIELASVIAALSLLGALALPLLAATRADSDRAGCFNNLRIFGRATHVWAGDHPGTLPWLTSTVEGGTRQDGIGNIPSVWTHFIALTNELPGPRVLACPSDPTVKAAAHWGNTANGLANTGLRNNAISYFLGLHGHPGLPRSVITGDRDFTVTTLPPNTCSRGYANTARIFANEGAPLRWTNAVHGGDAGHLLFADGGVDFTTSPRLNRVLAGPEMQNDNVVIHLSNPR